MAVLWMTLSASGQQSAPPAGANAEQSPATAPNKQATHTPTRKKAPLPGFLIIGTVFNERALAFPGVQVRVRQTGEKKFRWDTYTNSRGEFAVRVPEGQGYEVVVHARKYRQISREVNTNTGDVQQRLSIQLEPDASNKIGGKP